MLFQCGVQRRVEVEFSVVATSGLDENVVVIVLPAFEPYGVAWPASSHLLPIELREYSQLQTTPSDNRDGRIRGIFSPDDRSRQIDS